MAPTGSKKPLRRRWKVDAPQERSIQGLLRAVWGPFWVGRSGGPCSRLKDCADGWAWRRGGGGLHS
eukprot:5148950-Pyramimonas_sp.AAC.1